MLKRPPKTMRRDGFQPGGSPVRTARINDEIWFPAKERAYSEGRTMSHLISIMLSEYAEGKYNPPYPSE